MRWKVILIKLLSNISKGKIQIIKKCNIKANVMLSIELKKKIYNLKYYIKNIMENGARFLKLWKQEINLSAHRDGED